MWLQQRDPGGVTRSRTEPATAGTLPRFRRTDHLAGQSWNAKACSQTTWSGFRRWSWRPRRFHFFPKRHHRLIRDRRHCGSSRFSLSSIFWRRKTSSGFSRGKAGIEWLGVRYEKSPRAAGRSTPLVRREKGYPLRPGAGPPLDFRAPRCGIRRCASGPHTPLTRARASSSTDRAGSGEASRHPAVDEGVEGRCRFVEIQEELSVLRVHAEKPAVDRLHRAGDRFDDGPRGTRRPARASHRRVGWAVPQLLAVAPDALLWMSPGREAVHRRTVDDANGNRLCLGRGKAASTDPAGPCSCR